MLTSLLRRNLEPRYIIETAFGLHYTSVRYASKGVVSPEAALKQCMHALYKLVHPDLFHSQPEAKAENERSLKLLQDYIRQAKQGHEGHMYPPPYRFNFFVRMDKLKKMIEEAAQKLPSDGDKSVTNQQTSETSESAVEQVFMVLEPPGRNPIESSSMHMRERKELARLMSAIGLPKMLVGKLFDEEGNTSFRDFLPVAAEHTRKLEIISHIAGVHLSNARLALRLGRQVSVGLGTPCETLEYEERVRLVEDVAWTLDRVPNLDFSKLWIMIGAGQGIDACGRFWVGHDASRTQWLKHLMHADVDLMHYRQDLISEMKKFEAQLAKSLGVAMVYTCADLRISPAYKEFLKQLQLMQEKVGGISGGDYSKVPVCVVPQKEGSECCTVNEELGFVGVPLYTSSPQVYQFIQANGAKVTGILHNREKEEAALADLCSNVRRQLNLRKIEYASNVTLQQFRSCCDKLLRNSRELSYHLDGLTIKVAKESKIVKNRECVDIAWDFQL